MTVSEFLTSTTLPIYAFDRMSSFFIAALTPATSAADKTLFTEQYGNRRLFSYYNADSFIIIHI